MFVAWSIFHDLYPDVRTEPSCLKYTFAPQERPWTLLIANMESNTSCAISKSISQDGTGHYLFSGQNTPKSLWNPSV